MSYAQKNMDSSNKQIEKMYNTIPLFKHIQNKVDNFNKVYSTARYLAKNIRKRTTINKNYSSYGLKHIIEYEVGYMSNGEFILSALLAGFKMYNEYSINPSFNMNTKDIKFIGEKEKREKDVEKTQEEREFDSWYRIVCRF
jgi:hypothetical protein